jgi:hypothetical protein
VVGRGKESSTDAPMQTATIELEKTSAGWGFAGGGPGPDRGVSRE